MSDWHVQKCNTPAEAYRLLKSDRVWAGYAICDLESPLWERSTFFWLQKDGRQSLVLHHDAGAFHVLTAFGDPKGVNAAWSRIPLPQKAWYSLRSKQEVEGLVPYFQPQTLHPMWRLYLAGSKVRLSPGNIPVVRLGRDRCLEVEQLLQKHPECAYSPEQLSDGAFFGVEDHGELAALVGTHAVSIEYNIAAVGNAFTRPDVRGKGLFRACLSAVLHRLLRMGIQDVVANVRCDNIASLQGALSMGFEKHCLYWEGIGCKR
jgi:GNAT superfamily N-acetyltransferase